jgi:hypothetical protein
MTRKRARSCKLHNPFLAGTISGTSSSQTRTVRLIFTLALPDRKAKKATDSDRAGKGCKGWYTILRLYGPLGPWFDKTWRPGEIELVG